MFPPFLSWDKMRLRFNESHTYFIHTGCKLSNRISIWGINEVSPAAFPKKKTFEKKMVWGTACPYTHTHACEESGAAKTCLKPHVKQCPAPWWPPHAREHSYLCQLPAGSHHPPPRGLSSYVRPHTSSGINVCWGFKWRLACVHFIPSSGCSLWSKGNSGGAARLPNHRF